MRLLLLFLATDTLDPSTPPSLVMQVLEIAGKFALGRLAALAESLLISIIDPSNVCGFLQFADTHCRIQNADEDPSLPQTVSETRTAKPLQRGEALYNGCVSVLLREISKGMSDELKIDFNTLETDLQERVRKVYATKTHAYMLDEQTKSVRNIV